MQQPTSKKASRIRQRTQIECADTLSWTGKKRTTLPAHRPVHHLVPNTYQRSTLSGKPRGSSSVTADRQEVKTLLVRRGEYWLYPREISPAHPAFYGASEPRR